MKKLILLLSTCLFLFFTPSGLLEAQLTLPSIFGDNMVLQQQTDAAFWGKASPGAKVSVRTSWNGRSYSAMTDANGNWKTKVSTPAAGGPYTVTVSGGKTISFKNVLIGEVWVCSGQSNMEMPMKGYLNQPVLGSNEIIASSSNDRIRLITVPHATSLTAMDNFTGTWELCEPENVVDFSATAYFFGSSLNKLLNVPVGLICTSWGGTRIEPWINEEGLKNFDWVKLPDKSAPPQENLSPQTPTVLFNGMINPIAGYGIRGAIWYQGESNRNEPKEYAKLLPGLAENWRSAWRVGEFPFYYVQIAPYDYGSSGLNSAYLREAQLNAASAPNMGMACVMDTGEKECIHPANKKAAGERLAYQALVKTYGKKGFACEGPVVKDMKVEGQVVKLTFNNAPNGLTSFGKTLSCFEVAGANKRFFPAVAFITNQGITLMSPFVNEPVAVRYAFRDFIVGDLFNTEGIPASSFRTDDWE
ncbi:MAG: sialate O-acetylesterase [Bacteroidota bacterium]|nr:sialate O-acetylesterase [Bacteroidota bacterium]